MLLGNKVDKANRVVTKEQGEKLAKVFLFILLYLYFHIFLLFKTVN
jgi:hypothetical protein